MARGDINSSNTGQQRGSGLTDGSLDVAVLRILEYKVGLTKTTVQRIQELAGERFTAGDKQRPLAAVTRGDLSPVSSMKAMKSQKLTAAPTATDYNNLRDDVMQIFQALAAIATALDGTFRP